MTRLLFVTNDLFYFMTHRLSLAKAAREEGYEVHVACPPSEGVEKLAGEGLFFHPIPLARRTFWPRQEWKTFLAIVRLLRRLRPQIAHLLTLKPIVYGAFGSALVGTSGRILAFTGLGYAFSEDSRKALLMRKLSLLVLRFFFRRPGTTALVQNTDDGNLLTQKVLSRPSQLVVIRGSGVNVKEYRPHDVREARLVILASRMLWSKGIGDFVEAARQLRRRKVEARMVLVGDTDPGNPAAIPRESLQRWHQEGTIEWWGWRGDIPDILSRAAVVCLPSTYREGVPRVLIEAASAGAPVVATDVPGCREIVRHGENGLLVPPRRAKDLADAIRVLLEDSQMADRMGRRGREIVVAEFSEEIVNQATLNAYERLGARPSSSNTVTGRLRALQCVTLSEIGGAQNVVAALSRGLSDIATIEVATAPGGPLVANLRRDGITVHEVPNLVRPPAPFKDVRAFVDLCRIIREGSFDVVHAHSTKAGVLARVAASLAGVPTVLFTAHGWAFTEGRADWKRRLLAFVEKMAALFSTRIICVSHHDYQLAQALGVAPQRKLSVIWNGSDEISSTPSAKPRRAGILRVAFIGRLAPQKNPTALLNVADGLEGVEILVVGDGPQRGLLGEAIERRRLRSITLLGEVPDVRRILATVDALVLTSSWEGLPLVVLEAMYASLPVIATDVGGVREAVIHGKTGLLVAPGDYEGLRDALQRLRDDLELRTRMGATGLVMARAKFARADMVARYRAEYLGRSHGRQSASAVSSPTMVGDSRR